MALSERSSKVLRFIGYAVFFLVALLLFIRLTLPTGQMKEFIKGQLAERLSAESVVIEDLSINGLFPSGATVEGFELTLPPVKVKTPDRGVDTLSASRVLTIEQLSFDGSLLDAASGEFDFEFEGMVQGGEITGGRIAMKPGAGAKLVIEQMTGVAIGSESLFLSLMGMDVVGTLSGKVDVSIPSVERDGKDTLAFEQMAASVELKLDEAKMLGPVIDTVMNREPVRLAFTDVDLGTITIRAASDNQGGPATGADPKSPKRGVINIEEASVLGGDVEVSSAPKANIAIPPGGSFKDGTIALHLAVKIADAWFDKTEKDRKDPTKTTKPNSGLRTMMTLGPLKQHVVDGQFGVSLTGALVKPAVATTRPRIRVGAGGAGATGGRKLNVDQPGGDTDDDESGAPAKPSRASRSISRPEADKPTAAPVLRPAVGGGKPIEAAPARPRPNLAGPAEAAPVVAPTPDPTPAPEVPPSGEPMPVDPALDPGAPVEDQPAPE
jgi:type II secretion system protein N